MWDKCSRKSPADDLRIRLVSGWITKHAREMTSGLKVDLPAVVAVALKVRLHPLKNQAKSIFPSWRYVN